MRPEAILTSPSVVPHAERQGRHGSTETVVTAPAAAAMATEAIAQLHGRCFPSSVLAVVKTHRCLLNPVVIDQSTVQIVTARRTQ